MQRLRLFLACLVLLALPLQGALAASMRLCLPAGQPATASAGHHADHHAAHHAHSAPATASQAQGPAAELADGGLAAAAESDLHHTCDICAACGHAAALPAATARVASPSGVQAHPALAPARIDTRGLPVPDKPPRA